MMFATACKRLGMMCVAILMGGMLCSAGAQQAPKNQPASAWKSVEEAMGRPGVAQPGNAIRFNMPRTDLHVSVDGVEVKPGFALGSWATFASHGNEAMVMGDLVLRDPEIAPVMSKLVEGGIQVTALHNHLIKETPAVMYMHISGHGDGVRLARTIHDAVALTATPAPSSAPAAGSQDLGIDVQQVNQVLGREGRVNNGILQFTIPRAEKITESGMEVPPALGLGTAINFQPTGNGRAAITGDFVLLGTEVNPVIKALRENGIEVAAVHNHMLDEQPRLFFMHFWANDNAAKLARGLRAAIDKTNSQK